MAGCLSEKDPIPLTSTGDLETMLDEILCYPGHGLVGMVVLG